MSAKTGSRSSDAAEMAEWLRGFRDEHGLTPEALADLLGMELADVARLESGEVGAEIGVWNPVLFRLSRAIGGPVKYPDPLRRAHQAASGTAHSSGSFWPSQPEDHASPPPSPEALRTVAYVEAQLAAQRRARAEGRPTSDLLCPPELEGQAQQLKGFIQGLPSIGGVPRETTVVISPASVGLPEVYWARVERELAVVQLRLECAEGERSKGEAERLRGELTEAQEAADCTPPRFRSAEWQTLGRLLLGRTEREVAEELGVTSRTIERRVRSMVGKANLPAAARKEDLVAEAIRRNWPVAVKGAMSVLCRVTEA